MRAALGLAIVGLAAAASPARADFFNDVRRTFQEDIPRTFQHDIPRALGFQGKPAAPARPPVKPPAPAPSKPDQRTELVPAAPQPAVGPAGHASSWRHRGLRHPGQVAIG